MASGLSRRSKRDEISGFSPARTSDKETSRLIQELQEANRSLQSQITALTTRVRTLESRQ